jgi:hypothetical protein
MFKFFRKQLTSFTTAHFGSVAIEVSRKDDPGVASNQGDSRSFYCPACKDKTLRIVKSIELGSDSRDDEYSLQAIQCGRCNCVGVSTYQESRRGAEESWDHLGHKMDNIDYESFLQQLGKCTSPTKANCRCETHRLFGIKNEHGRLSPLEGLKFEKPHFIMRLH